MENKKYWLNKSMLINDNGANKQLINGEVVPDNIISRWTNQKTKSGKTELEARLASGYIVDDKEKLTKIANPAVASTTDKRGEALSETTKPATPPTDTKMPEGKKA